jgi:hypothetical protein
MVILHMLLDGEVNCVSEFQVHFKHTGLDMIGIQSGLSLWH